MYGACSSVLFGLMRILCAVGEREYFVGASSFFLLQCRCGAPEGSIAVFCEARLRATFVVWELPTALIELCAPDSCRG